MRIACSCYKSYMNPIELGFEECMRFDAILFSLQFKLKIKVSLLGATRPNGLMALDRASTLDGKCTMEGSAIPNQTQFALAQR